MNVPFAVKGGENFQPPNIQKLNKLVIERIVGNPMSLGLILCLGRCGKQ